MGLTTWMKKCETTCVHDGVDRDMCCRGQVQKMKRKVGTRWESCMQPIDLQNREVNKGKKIGIVGSGFMVYLNYSRRVSGHFKFKYDHSNWVHVYSIICTTTMSFNAKRDVFEFDPVDGTPWMSLLKSLDEIDIDVGDCLWP